MLQKRGHMALPLALSSWQQSSIRAVPTSISFTATLSLPKKGSAVYLICSGLITIHKQRHIVTQQGNSPHNKGKHKCQQSKGEGKLDLDPKKGHLVPI